MQNRRFLNTNSGKNPNPFSSMMALLVFFAVVAFIFLILYGFIKILYLVAPILLIITLFINPKVVKDYLVSTFTMFKTNLMMGVLRVATIIVGYPFVIVYLFIKALFYQKMNNIRKQYDPQTTQPQQDQYTEYEEISSTRKPDIFEQKPEEPTIIEMPKPKEKDKINPYDNLFDDK